jgi:hypothetical protein
VLIHNKQAKFDGQWRREELAQKWDFGETKEPFMMQKNEEIFIFCL